MPDKESTQLLTVEELDAIEARANAARVGPWEAERQDPPGGTMADGNDETPIELPDGSTLVRGEAAVRKYLDSLKRPDVVAARPTATIPVAEMIEELEGQPAPPTIESRDGG